jgi:hypothetical protein
VAPGEPFGEESLDLANEGLGVELKVDRHQARLSSRQGDAASCSSLELPVRDRTSDLIVYALPKFHMLARCHTSPSVRQGLRDRICVALVESLADHG